MCGFLFLDYEIRFRQSKWHEESFGYTLPIGKIDRCKEKIQQDIAFVDIYYPKETFTVSTLERKFGFVDMAGIFGIGEKCQ